MESLRVDAERNRRQLIEAARVTFAERGLDAPLDEIARRAGVGNATLYRRFPTRHDLVAAVFVETMRQVTEEAQRALNAVDPWRGFVDQLTFLCRLQAENRAFADLLTSHVGSTELETMRGQAFDLLVTIINRARDAQVLRADFTHQDVVVLLMANAGLVERTIDTAPTAWRRHLNFVLDGLSGTIDAEATAPPAPAEILQAMEASGVRNGCSS